MLKFKINCQSGFTLLEIIIALFVFSIGILGVSAMQLTSLKGNSKAARITEASNVAADQIEKIMGLPYGTFTDGSGTSAGADGLDDFPTTDGSTVSADGNYKVYWNVAENVPSPNTKTIKVIVDPPGRGKRVSMVIIKADIEN
ncbi:MAG: prepilin-type N-terminal cleavage/methylation domain-containing protein [Desulfuromusa sp.]|nr:prepilin-type N-terminal cleavage/methylation domain-containing protein [Desulfuromusa sp.]